MELRPILSAMLRNKLGAALVGLQIAITLAVVANSVFIIVQRMERIGQPTGIDSDNVFFVQSYGHGSSYDQRATVRQDLDIIRAIPGVVSASSISGIPMSGGGRSSGFSVTTDAKTKISANTYDLDEQGLASLGVRLLEGRAFTAAEIQYNPNPTFSDFVPAIILTRDLAQAMFGDEPALGRQVYDDLNQSAVVVGIIDNMLNAWVTPENPTHVLLQPRVSPGPTARYVVRTERGQRDSIIAQVESKLSALDLPRAVTWVRPHSYYVAKAYREDSRMIWFLSIIVGLMISVTALGIVGLASFHVSVRTKQIGTRRAVGARKVDIMRYFMLENWLLTTAGLVVGTVLAFAIGQWLSSAYSLPRLQPGYVAAGIVLLWLLGQAAVFAPARRAAAIPPAIATRTV